MLRDTRQHAFGNDSLRWHVCAYCHIDGKLRTSFSRVVLKLAVMASQAPRRQMIHCGMKPSRSCCRRTLRCTSFMVGLISARG